MTKSIAILFVALFLAPAAQACMPGWRTSVSYDTLERSYWWAYDGTKKYSVGGVYPDKQVSMRQACKGRVGCEVRKVQWVENYCPEPATGGGGGGGGHYRRHRDHDHGGDRKWRDRGHRGENRGGEHRGRRRP